MPPQENPLPKDTTENRSEESAISAPDKKKPYIDTHKEGEDLYFTFHPSEGEQIQFQKDKTGNFIFCYSHRGLITLLKELQDTESCFSKLVGKSQSQVQKSLEERLFDCFGSLPKERVLELLKELEDPNSSFSHVIGHLRNQAKQILRKRQFYINISRHADSLKLIYEKIDYPIDDLALTNVDKIQPAWIPLTRELRDKLYIPVNTTPDLINDHISSMIARNLFHQKKDVSKQSVTDELNRLMHMREQYAGISLIRTRNVLIVGHNEENGQRFLPNTLREAIKQQGPSNYIFITIGEDEVTEKNIKEKVRDAIRSTPPPFTFMFNGHGGKEMDRIMLSKNIFITAEEIAQDLMTRRQRFKREYEALKPDQKEKDILFFWCCFGATIGDSISKKVSSPKIVISSNEFNQVSFIDDESPQKCRMLEALFKRNPKDSRVRDVMAIEFDPWVNQDSNPTMFIEDDEDNLPRTQITKNTDALPDAETPRPA